MVGLRLATLFFTVIELVRSAAPPYGKLSVQGTKLVGEGGQEVVLRGMSLFWSQWSEGSVFYHRDAVQSLKCSWNANLVRAAMGVESGGYLTNPAVEQARVETVVQAAIDFGIYVIIDWHDHNAHQHTNKAVEFFTAMSKKYGANPHIIYEIFNEPLQVPWDSIKPYHQQVVAAIRANDPHNIIVLGTPTWSQDVDIAANSPVSGTNLMYTLHYYAGTHKQFLRDKATAALNKGIALFVTEYGTVNADGNGNVDTQESNTWWGFLEAKKISYANWAVSNKAEGSAALQPGTTAQQVGDDSRLTTSGKFVKDKLKTFNNGVSCSGGVPVPTTQPPTQPPVQTTTTGGGSTPSGLSASIEVVNNWGNGAQYKLIFKNTGTGRVCGAVFNLNLPSGATLDNFWNFSRQGNGYTLPSWVNIAQNGIFQDAGFVMSGGNGQLPNVGIVSIKTC